MALVLNTNVDSLIAQNALTSSGSTLAMALQQLSTGLRINTAADDAAGYAIVNGMTSQINGLNQAAQNANDGVSLTQTASGALTEIVNDLQSMRDLAVESLNATNSSNDRQSLNQQYQQLAADINSVANNTQFNGVNLLNGSFQGATFQIGANVGQTITVGSVASSDTGNLGQQYTTSITGVLDGTTTTAGVTTTTASVDLADVLIDGEAVGSSSVTSNAAYASAVNAAGIAGVTAQSTVVGGAAAGGGTAGDSGTIVINGVATAAVTAAGTTADAASTAAAINAISGSTGVTATIGTGSNADIITLTNTSGGDISLSYTGSLTGSDTGVAATNTATGYVLNYSSTAPGTLSVADTNTSGDTSGAAATSSAAAQTGTLVGNTDVLTVTDSNSAIKSIDAALQQVDSIASQIGAYQNRFAAAVTGLNTDSTNLSSARSTIEDTDYAQATSTLSKAQILQQAGTAMVAQANTIPQNVLTLLQKLP